MGDRLRLRLLGKLRPKVTKWFTQGSAESGETAANVLMSLLCANMYVCVHCVHVCAGVHAPVCVSLHVGGLRQAPGTLLSPPLLRCDYKHVLPCPAFSVGGGDLNLGPHAYKCFTNNLLPSPLNPGSHPQAWFPPVFTHCGKVRVQQPQAQASVNTPQLTLLGTVRLGLVKS